MPTFLVRRQTDFPNQRMSSAKLIECRNRTDLFRAVDGFPPMSMIKLVREWRVDVPCIAITHGGGCGFGLTCGFHFRRCTTLEPSSPASKHSETYSRVASGAGVIA